MVKKGILLKIIKIKKVVTQLKKIEELKGTKEYLIRSFAFYYNNIY